VAGEEGTSRTKSAALKGLQPDEDVFVGETMVVADLLNHWQYTANFSS